MLPFLMSEMMRGSPGFLLAVEEDDVTINSSNNNNKYNIPTLYLNYSSIPVTLFLRFFLQLLLILTFK